MSHPGDVPDYGGWAAYRDGGWRIGVPVAEAGGVWAPVWALAGVPGGGAAVAPILDAAMGAAGWGAWR